MKDRENRPKSAVEDLAGESLFYEAASKYPNIFVIMSPARGGSTTLSRVFWEHPSVGYYAHEPFEIVYFEKSTLSEVARKIESPLDLREIKKNVAPGESNNALVIKEMPYQVGKFFPLLLSIATKPLIFLIRDPRLTITSRMRKKEEVGASPIFPLVETGYELIFSEIYYCRANNIPYVVIESNDFRNHPSRIFRKLFEKFNLNFSEEMLTWRSLPDVDIDNLSGKHTHLYKRALLSVSIQPTTEPIPSVNAFPYEGGFREHIYEYLKIYWELKKDTNRIK